MKAETLNHNALRGLINGKRWSSGCDIREPSDKHMIVFAAEASKLAGGAMIEIDEFEKRI